MNTRLYIIALLLSTGILLSFIIEPSPSISEKVKAQYLADAIAFQQEASYLNKLINSGNEKKFQQQFLVTRLSYKKIEIFVEYFYPFYAGKMNGPPISYYEESEPDIGEQQPTGMQLIESYIFPSFQKNKTADLVFQAKELERYALELLFVNNSFAFDDNNIWDAIMEQLYRLTSLSITGFDSQSAVNSLPEMKSVLLGIGNLLIFYKKSFEEEKQDFRKIHALCNHAQNYISQNMHFNSFDRLAFIRLYLNPITSLAAAFKNKKGYTNNPAGMFYSSVKKNNSLFAKDAFNPYRFLDDYNSNSFKIALGKKLFFEEQLSSDKKRSCASCHNPSLAFTDGLPKSKAIDGHTILARNAPTIWNAALQRNLFYDSRSRTLEDQVMQVLNNANEMHGSATVSAKNILQMNDYKILYAQAFPQHKAEDAAINICNAISSYERTLIALNSRFDHHMRGENVLNKNEINGFNLFMGKAKCGTCHFMPLFSGAKPPRFYFIESEVIGVPESNQITNAKLDKDSGRYLITKQQVHLFSFKTPGLRNVALTAPYMHNGVFKTLEEVINFYNEGGGKGLHIAPINQSLPFEKLGLIQKEKLDIVAFLKTLTDTTSVY